MIINQIFSSINGEVSISHQGSLCTFVRVAGCNLDCQYPCDTPYAKNLNQGKEMSIDEVAKEAASFRNTNITITGGEPLLQSKEVIQLSKILYDSGFDISIETNGTFEMCSYPWIHWVADWKGPSSGMREKMYFPNYRHLRPNDFIKFVIAGIEDFKDAMEVINGCRNSSIPCKFAFSPSFDRMDPVLLIEWMKEEPLLKERGAIFSYQIHKVLNLKEV